MRTQTEGLHNKNAEINEHLKTKIQIADIENQAKIRNISESRQQEIDKLRKIEIVNDGYLVAMQEEYNQLIYQ